MGFYAPDSGRILINGADLREYDRESLLALTACVFQNVLPYALPVEKNITASREKADAAKLQKVLQAACLADIFDPDNGSLENDLTREFSEDGIILSGGQLQKTALARALYRDASLLVLDESTSAADPETEIQLMETVARQKKGRIVMQISHKLSCARNGSKILYLEKGRILESGTHEELLARKGSYYELFSHQAEKFRIENEKSILRKEVWA